MAEERHRNSTLVSGAEGFQRSYEQDYGTVVLNLRHISHRKQEKKVLSQHRGVTKQYFCSISVLDEGKELINLHSLAEKQSCPMLVWKRGSYH